MNNEYNEVKDILDRILLDNNIVDKVTLSYGQIYGCPEEFSIIRKSLGWYYYMSDDRNNGFYEGPYDLNALIHMIVNRFPIKKEIRQNLLQNYPSEKLENFEYIDNKLFKTEQEIEEYEIAHPEKKVE